MSKIVTYAELKEHTKKESVWLLISGKGALPDVDYIGIEG